MEQPGRLAPLQNTNLAGEQYAMEPAFRSRPSGSNCSEQTPALGGTNRV
jgi:hypothetical protein